MNLAVARGHLVSIVGAPHRRDVHASPDGSARDLGEVLDELGHFAHRHVAVWIRAFIVKARQTALPVGREQPQGVPAFAPPGVRYLAALEHDMIDRPVAEKVARREARVPRADDDRSDALDDLAPQATSTVTFVGFVRASNTADRFWDWATSASISCLDASASMVNVTLTSLKPLRTSLSAPRMPRMSCAPSTVDSTERNWMPRFSATDATPAVRQLARPTRRYSIGVMPLSSAAKTSGWSASNTDPSLWLCSSPRPKKLWTLIVLWTPLCHVADARQVN